MSNASYIQLHDEACSRGETTYTDPETGYTVFTKLGLLERDRCCGAGCWHCPFEHQSVPLQNRAAKIQQAAWLSEQRPCSGSKPTVLFWSGGKDSFLTYLTLSERGAESIVLLTTFDARSRVIANQGFSIDHVVEQAKHLGLPLIGVPVHPNRKHIEHVSEALSLVPECRTLAFGDLHLESIRSWREKTFNLHPQAHSIELIFPVWQADYASLLDRLEGSGATCTISAVAPSITEVSIGEKFDRTLVNRLPASIDGFGENGEFHTCISFAGVGRA